MQFNQAIRRIISAFLICILGLSITPLFVAHTLFATHKDKSQNNSLTGIQLSESGYNCNCENFVAEGQFVKDCLSFEIISINVQTIYNTSRGYTFFTQPHFFSELRGPPVAV